jgi:hypothetical protein
VADAAGECSMSILIFLPAATIAIAAYVSIVVFTMSGNAQSRQLLIDPKLQQLDTLRLEESELFGQH